MSTVRPGLLGPPETEESPPAPPPPTRPLHAPTTSWPTAAPSRTKPESRVNWKLYIAILALVSAIAATYAIGKRALSGTPRRDIQLYTVMARTFPVTLEEKGELKAAQSIEIRCELEGKSTIIRLVDEGTRAKTGDLLVELASDAIDDNIRDAEIKDATAQAAYEAAVKEQEILQDENLSKIRKAELAFQLAQIALEKYKEGDAVELRQTATLAVEKGRSVLKRAQEDFKDSNDLYAQGFVTRIELENDRFKQFEAEIELKKAQLALEVLDKYTYPMNMQEKQSDVTEASKELDRTRKSATASEGKAFAEVAAKKSELQLVKEKLEKLRDQKKKAKIFAPADGLVVYARDRSWYRSETQIQTGASVYERQPLIELPDTSSMKVVIRVHEAQTERLRPGLPAMVEIEGFSGRQYTGRVSRIAVLADSQNRWLNPNLKEYETEILLDGTFKDLKPGLTTRAQVQLAQLNNVLAVPVQSVFGKGGKYYVFIEKDQDAKPIEVQVGLSSNEYVEIRKGLTSGQVVRLAVTDEMKLMLPEGEPTDLNKARPAPLATPVTSGPAGAVLPESASSRPASALSTRPSGGSNGSGGSGRSGRPPRSERGPGR